MNSPDSPDAPHRPLQRPSLADPAPALRSLVARLPLWAIAIVAVLCIVGGGILTLSPFTSASVLALLIGLNAMATGALMLVAREEAPAAHSALFGVGWLLLGLVILARPGLTVVALAIVVGVALLVTGLMGIVGALAVTEQRPTTWDDLAATLVGSLASMIFGILALSWRDVTVFVVAVLFGARTALFGFSQLFLIITQWRRSAPPTVTPEGPAAAPGWLQRSLRLATRLGALLLALILIVVSVALHSHAPAPVPPFYDWTGAAPSTPGDLLRSEPLPGAVVPSNAQGWRILYSTKTSLGQPAVGSAFILAPKELLGGPRPVILWTHGTTGITRPCAPSLFPDVTTAVPGVPGVLERGWVMVAPDYVGLGTAGPTPYLIGAGEAYSALDAVRAARQFKGVSLSNQIVVWGHSQGGHAALWTGNLASRYAPGLKIDGVAALAPATDLVPLGERMQSIGVGTILSAYLIAAYSDTYSDVRLSAYVRPGATVKVIQAAQRCVTDPSLAASLIAGVSGQSVSTRDVGSGALGARLRENTPTADMGSAPLLVAQGTGDEIINIALTQQWVTAQCAAGYRLAFTTYPDLTHLGIIHDATFTTNLINWTVDRFAGRPAPNTCV